MFALAFRDVHTWYALNILFVFAGVTQLLLPHYRRDTRRWRTTDTEWDNAFSHPTCGHAIGGYSPHAGITGHRRVTDTKLCSGQRKALYATPFFYFAYPGYLALLALALWIPVS